MGAGRRVRQGAVFALTVFPVLVLSLGMLTGCVSWWDPPYPGDRAGRGYTVTVRPGDTFFGIARRMNLSVDELILLNRAKPPFTLYPGDTLLLPEPSFHVVRTNETLVGIARLYGVPYRRLARLNGIENPGQVRPGVRLRIPDSSGAVPRPARHPDRAQVSQGDGGTRVVGSARRAPAPVPFYRSGSGSGGSTPQKVASAMVPRLDWPVRGRVISSYGSKGKGAYNDGINIAVATGTPVRAAAGGTVIYRGHLVPGFGRLLLLRHEGGLVTAYAHLLRFEVQEGAKVSRGQMIGRVGSSGSVTTPQLHFEVRRGTRAVDPLPFLTAPRST